MSEKIMDKFDLFYRMLGNQARNFSKVIPEFELFLVLPSGCTAHLAVAYKIEEGKYKVVASMDTLVRFDKYVKFAFVEEIYVLQEKIYSFLEKVKSFYDSLEFYKCTNKEELIKLLNIFPEHGLKPGSTIEKEINADFYTKGTKDSSSFAGSPVIPLNINSPLFYPHINKKRNGYYYMLLIKENIDVPISYN